ncbi:TrbC/VirB2 family protein [Qipengyuania sediminis]|uniref:TrbC/VirB2 family protein n=1 Tax=Qipengyuania sediminis TaxID=1532023 RepID=UPI00105A367A
MTGTFAQTDDPFSSGQAGAVDAAAGWLQGLVTGSLAVALCAIAVAMLGILMFTGRMPVRNGVRVVLGCFILLGAPPIAAAFLELGARDADGFEATPSPAPSAEPRPLPTASYDPYAGASLRQD